jgi:hypothetical protein
MTKRDQIFHELLYDLTEFLLEDTSKIDILIKHLADILEAKNIVLCWKNMSDDEATNPNCSHFLSKIKTDVEGECGFLGLTRSCSDRFDSCKVIFAVVASLVSMARDEVMNDYTEESFNDYVRFVNALKEAAFAGTEALFVSHSPE